MIASRAARKSINELPPIDLSKIAEEDNELCMTSPDSSTESSVRSSSTITPKLDSPLDSPARRGRLVVKSRSKKSPSSGEHVLVITNRLPIDANEISRNFQEPFVGVHNDADQVKKILARIARGPSEEDKHGYIYIYKLKEDAGPSYRKIGRTEKLPSKRVAEWSGDAELIRSWRCRRNRYAEAIIHLMLDSLRVFRYQVYLTLNTHTGLFVQDTAFDWVAQQTENKARTAAKGKKSNIEWFLVGETTAFDVINRVVSVINGHYVDGEPWSEEMEQMK